MKRPRILIAEDEASTARVLYMRLEELGYEPIGSVASAEEAIALAGQLRPELVLMDIQLAGKTDGIDAAKTIHEQLSIPTVFLTGLADEATVQRAKGAEPFGYLVKPFVGRELRSTIEMALHRHSAEKRLNGSHEKLTALLQTTTDGFMGIAPDGHILEINDEGSRLTGYAPGELQRMTVAQLAVDKSAAELKTLLKQVRTDGSARCECRLRRKDAREIDAEVNLCFSTAAKRIFCFFRDVTGHKQTEKKLRQLSRAVEQSPVTIVITDTQGRIEYANPRFVETTGYTVAEALGQNPRLLKSGEQSADFYHHLWATISAGHMWHGEFHNRRKDGQLYWESASISPVRDALGHITHFIAIKEDITEQKRIAEALGLRESYFSAIIENQPGPAWLKDLAGRFLAVNRTYVRLSGRKDAAELIGRTDYEIWPSERAEANWQRDLEIIQSGATQIYEEELRVGSELRWYETFNTAVRDASGQVIATTGYAHEVTQRKREELELLKSKTELQQANAQLQAAVERERELAIAAEAANRAKSLFLASMSHELRTPLNVINGMAAIMVEQAPNPEKAQLAGMILTSGQSLLGIIEEILDYTSLQVGRAKLDSKPFELLPVVVHALRLAGEAARAKAIDLTYRVAPAVPAVVQGDARRLQQVLVNLLQNAVKFTNRGSVNLSVGARRRADGQCHLSFTVVDTGIGIDRAEIAKLFQPFSQANGEIVKNFGGTGLGLAISRSFANQMSGDVVVRSVPGRGSAFRCSIVVPTPEPREAALARVAPPALRGRHLLAVVAHIATRRLLSALATAWGMRVTLYRRPPAMSPAAGCYDFALYDATLAGPPPASQLPVAWLGQPTAPAGDALSLPLDPAELGRVLTHLLAPANGAEAPALGAPGKPLKLKLGERLPLRILAADDIRTNREMVRQILSHLGYKPEVVENGAEVLVALSQQAFDLLLLDVQMPVMDGLTAAQEIVRMYPDRAKRPKIVALTANALPEDRETCLAAGMDDYLSKPVLPADLEACFLRQFGQAPKEKAVPAPAPVASAERPWVDAAHLAAVLPGLGAAQAAEALSQMHAAAIGDYREIWPRVGDACARRDSARFAELVHGLKGCFKMLGWVRLADRCTEALGQARRREFTEWETFPDELQRLFATSNTEMARYLASLAPADAHHESTSLIAGGTNR